MKINNKLLIAVFLVVIPMFMILFFLINELNQKLTDQREAKEYEDTGNMIEQIIRLQENKLGLIFDSINHDTLFLHSVLLYEDLGYKDRLLDILSEYKNKNEIDLFVFLGRNEEQVSNSPYQLSETEINLLCHSSSKAKVITKPIQAYLRCFPVDYHNNALGNLIIKKVRRSKINRQ